MSEFKVIDGCLVIDENHNKADFAYWGGEEAAIASLKTLVDCNNCDNCIDCKDCKHCSRCDNCTACKDYCTGCIDCHDCTGCIDCTTCTDCVDCASCLTCNTCDNCKDCDNCDNCIACTNCIDCTSCTDCVDCHDCLRCHGCVICVMCYDCIDCHSCINDHNLNTVTGDMALIPVITDIHKKVYAAASQPGALNMCNWHCGSSHCRAGWVVHLAGDAGYELEHVVGTPLAAMLIYRVSGYECGIPHFFMSNEKALADLKRLAEVE